MRTTFAFPALVASARAVVLSLVMTLVACGGSSEPEPEPPKAEFQTIRRSWTFLLLDADYNVSNALNGQKHGPGVVDDPQVLGDFHLKPDDVAPPAQLQVYSNENGMTYWVSAQTFDDVHADPERVVNTRTVLFQDQYFVKQEDNATLRFVVSDAVIELIDRNPDNQQEPRPLTSADCAPRTNCNPDFIVGGRVRLEIRAWNLETHEYFYSAASLAEAWGYQQHWLARAGAVQDYRRIWTDAHFALDPDVTGQGHGYHSRYKLTGQRVIEIPLAGIERGQRFGIRTYAESEADDIRHQQTYASAYLRDPQSSSGLGIEYTGLEPVAAPDEEPPPYVSQPAPVCGPTPTSGAGSLQLEAATFLAVESVRQVPVYITRNDGSSGEVSVYLTASGGTATAGIDYASVTTHVKFEDGETGARIVFVPLLADDAAETDETVNLTLSDPRGCAVLGARSSAVLTILDNDTPVPTPLTYTVGGTVTGLAGSGLEVEEIKTGKRLKPANGSFVFDYAYPDAAPYEVRIVSQPTSPIQSCSVANPTRTIASANVSDIDISCTTPAGNGALDPSFGSGGKVVAALTDGGVAGALQGDGKIVVVGDMKLMRFNADGSVDTGFGHAGTVNVVFNGGTFDEALGLAVQPDGKIVVVGTTRVGTQDDFAIARYNTDGSADTGFGTLGRTSVAVYEDFQKSQVKIAGAADRAHKVIVLPDGDLLLVGHGGYIDQTIAGMPVQENHYAVARLNSDGTRDTGFDGNGVTTGSPNGAGGSFAYAGALTADGKLVVGGKAATDGVSEGDLGLVRFNANGQMDTTFGPSDLGWALLDNGDQDEISDAIVLANGWIAVAARSMDRGGQPPLFRFTLALFNEDGRDQHIEQTPIGPSHDLANAMALQADSKILLAGEASATASTDFGLVRYDVNGRLDPSFGNNGVVTVDFFGGVDSAKDMLVQPDGKIVLIGVVRNGSRWDLGIARVLP